MAFEEMTFEYFYANLSFLVAMETNQIHKFGQNSYFGRELLKEHFCKTFVKISTVR